LNPCLKERDVFIEYWKFDQFLNSKFQLLIPSLMSLSTVDQKEILQAVSSFSNRKKALMIKAASLARKNSCYLSNFEILC